MKILKYVYKCTTATLGPITLVSISENNRFLVMTNMFYLNYRFISGELKRQYNLSM